MSRRAARLAAAALGLVGLAVLAAPARAGCQPPAWTAQAGTTHSRWQEQAPDGRRLLTEQGLLATAELQHGRRCDALHWQAALALAGGVRDYDGRSSLGQPIQTHSRLRRLGARAALLQAWPAGRALFGGDWQVGAGLGWQRQWRRIAPAGTVLGYPERFEQWQVSALLAHQRPWRPGLVLQTRLALGGGPPGRLLLQLPTADAARLRLGASAHVGLELAWTGEATGQGGGPAAPAGWRVGLQWRLQRTAAGPSATLWRGTLPVGAAAQPAVRERELGLVAGWHW